MVIDNFNLIKPILHFEPSHKSIILVYLVSRKKDGNTKVNGSNRVRTIKSYYFQSIEYLEEKINEIRTICSAFNCRAYICIQPKLMKKVLFTLQRITMDGIEGMMSADNKIHLTGFLDSAVMKTTALAKYKYWVVDVDQEEKDSIIEQIKQRRHGEGEVIKAVLPTVQGWHIITTPFDSRDFEIENGEIKKSGLTLLYYTNEG